jgi:hypothetical protein
MNSHLTVAQPREAALSHLCPAERLDEEAKTLALEISRIITTTQPKSAEQLAESIRKAELLIVNGFNRTLAEIAKATAPASVAETKTELALLVGAFPNASKGDLRIFGRMLVEDVAAQRPSVAALSLACRRLRRTARFVPTISEVLEAIGTAEVDVLLRARTLERFGPWLERARVVLPRMQERERLEDEDRHRRRQAYAEREKELANDLPLGKGWRRPANHKGG